MGIKEEITKIAVEQGYEGAKPKSIAQAIDALTDTLAGEDVKSGRSVVGAVKALAPYIGGGGTTLGSMQYAVVYDTSEPTVGGDAYYIPLTVITVHVGSQLVIGKMPGDSDGAPSIAAGATVKAYASMDMLAGKNPVITPYVITDSAEQKYTSVTPWDGTYTHAIEQIDNQDCLAITFTIPELDASEGERLLFAIIG